MSKRTRKPTLKLIESLQSGADEFCLSGEDTVLSGTEDCWLEDIDLKYVYVLCLCTEYVLIKYTCMYGICDYKIYLYVHVE